MMMMMIVHREPRDQRTHRVKPGQLATLVMLWQFFVIRTFPAVLVVQICSSSIPQTP